MRAAPLLFIPAGVVSGVLAGRVARKAFDLAWTRISADPPPEPEQRDAPIGTLAAALALEGAISRLSSGLVERGARIAFHRATGAWPGADERRDA